MRIERIVDAAALDRIEPDWQALFDRCPAAPPFTAPAWLIPWWRVFAPGRLASIAVWDGDHLVAFAPAYVEDGPEQRRLLPLGIGMSDHLDVLVDPACVAEAGAALACGVGDMRAEWACWSIEEALPHSAALRLPDPVGCQSEVSAQSASPMLRLSRAGESLEDVIPNTKRRKWRMAQNRIARRDWHLIPAAPDTLAGDLDSLFRLHGARWQSRGETGVLADAQVRAFHHEAAPRLLAAGLLRLLTLRIDGTVAGAFYGLSRGSMACAYLGGFDPAFAYESPGTILIGAAIAAAESEGASEFHFLRGQEPYKYEWGAEDLWLQRRLVVPA